MRARKFLTSLIAFSASSLLFSSTASTDVELNARIIDANAGVDTTINFQNSITLTGAFGQPLLRPLDTLPNFTPAGQNITINGNNFTLNGANAFRGFFIRGSTVMINNLTFSNTRAIGGAGSSFFFGGGGGGGAGLGGAIYVVSGATAILTNPVFTSSNATGGMGGSFSNTSGFGGGGGGGGGLTGNGGTIPGEDGGAGGGGFAFRGGNSSASGGGGGATGSPGGDADDIVSGAGGSNWVPQPGGASVPANSSLTGADGLFTGTGGGGGANGLLTGGIGGAGNTGGGGGGGGSAENGEPLDLGNGGPGGIYGAGGGGGKAINPGSGGNGGFAGGGGGGGANSSGPGTPANGGTGGFGGGGGGGGDSITSGSFGLGGSGTGGGGNGANGTGDPVSSQGGAGGGGAGYGGAIFIENGGNLTIVGSALFQGNSVTPGLAGGAGATNGAAAGPDIFMMGGGAITFNITQNVSIPTPIVSDGVIAGGGLTKSGCATLTLNGANTYTGTTIVQAGTLRINGSIVTDIQNNGGTISGNFSTPGTLTNNSVVAPGNNGVGQITVGTFINQPTGVLQISINPGFTPPNNSLQVGSATLAGTLEVFLNSGNYVKGTQFAVINGPTAGTFAQVIQTGPAAGSVILTPSYSSVILTVTEHSLFTHQTIDPGIQSDVVNCILNANIIPGSDFATVIAQLGMLSNSGLNAVLFNLSPVNYGTLDWINAYNTNQIVDILSERLFEIRCSPCEPNAIWIDFYGSTIENKRHFDNLVHFRAKTAGVVGGYDFTLCQKLNVGAAGGYQHNWLHFDGNFHKGDSHSAYGALYSSYQGCCFDADISAIAGGSTFDLERSISFQEILVQNVITPNLCGGDPTFSQVTSQVILDRKAKAKPKAFFATGHFGFNLKWDWNCKILEPFVLADYQYFHRKSFNEHGADSLNLSVQKHNQHFMRGEAGLKMYRIWDTACFCFAPYLGLSWVGEFPLGKSHQKASFIGQDCVIDVTNAHSSVQFFSPMGGIKWTTACNFSFSMNYKGLFSKRAKINEADIRWEWAF